jgi:integrase/recombinase XerD
MAEAWITGTPRHAQGLEARVRRERFSINVPPHLVRRWLGPASLRTTAIYADVVGPDERAFGFRSKR